MIQSGGGRFTEDLRKAHFQALYYCDPEKNTECKKTDCYMNGGYCRRTTRRDCAVLDGGMPMVAKILRFEGRGRNK